jgi:undecaprenyl diphosphate synthase
MTDSASESFVPQHIAIIMDGNGRWANSRGWKRSLGHYRGSAKVKEIIREADKLGVKVLSLYCFSTENWRRPLEEVETLMRLLKSFLIKERDELHANGVQVRVLGQLEKIPAAVRAIVTETIDMTSKNNGMVLNFCISYGSRHEIVDAVKVVAERVQSGELKPSEINEELISSLLYTGGLPDPDLLIRTSGEFRISNFFLWQLAYSEILILDKYWPDFGAEDLRNACQHFSRRERRFGATPPTPLRPGIAAT